jgi:hypothetical protein
MLNVIEYAPHLDPTWDPYAANFNVSTTEKIRDCADNNSRCPDRIIRHGRVASVPCRCLWDNPDIVSRRVGKKSVLRSALTVSGLVSMAPADNAHVVIAMIPWTATLWICATRPCEDSERCDAFYLRNTEKMLALMYHKQFVPLVKHQVVARARPALQCSCTAATMSVLVMVLVGTHLRRIPARISALDGCTRTRKVGGRVHCEL